MPMNLKKDDKSILNLGFLEALSKIRKYEKVVLKRENMDITPKELNYLAVIKYHPDLKQSEIHELFDISKGSFSIMLKLLVDKGYIKAVASKEDKRVKTYTLTAKGEKAILINDKIRERIKIYLLQRLTEKELDTFINLALKMR